MKEKKSKDLMFSQVQFYNKPVGAVRRVTAIDQTPPQALHHPHKLPPYTQYHQVPTPQVNLVKSYYASPPVYTTQVFHAPHVEYRYQPPPPQYQPIPSHPPPQYQPPTPRVQKSPTTTPCRPAKQPSPTIPPPVVATRGNEEPQDELILSSVLREKSKDIKSLEQRIDELMCIVEQKDKTLFALQQQCDIKTEEIGTLRKSLEERETKVKQLTDKVSELTNKITESENKTSIIYSTLKEVMNRSTVLQKFLGEPEHAEAQVLENNEDHSGKSEVVEQ